MGEVTVSEIENLCQKYSEVREKIDATKQDLENFEAERRTFEAKILACLDGLGKTRWDFGSHTLSTVEKFSYKTPKTPHAKDELYAYLKARGVYDDLISVNSQTLNAFVKREMEIALEEGKTDFSIPGLEEPTLYKTLSLRGKK